MALPRETRLAEWLRAHRLTVSEFARLGPFPVPSVSFWVRGLRRPGLAHGLRIDTLTGGEIPAGYWPTVRIPPRKLHGFRRRGAARAGTRAAR